MKKGRETPQDGCLKDYGALMHLLHHVAVDGVIVWPVSRAGQVVKDSCKEKALAHPQPIPHTGMYPYYD